MTNLYLVPSYQMEVIQQNSQSTQASGLSASFTPPKTHRVICDHTKWSSLITDGHGTQRRKHITTCHQLWLNSAIADSGLLILQLVTSAWHWARHCLAFSSIMGTAEALSLLVATSRLDRVLPQLPALFPRDWHCRGYNQTVCSSSQTTSDHLQSGWFLQSRCKWP